MRPASTYGPEQPTYVLSAIRPEARSVDRGEVMRRSHGNKKALITDAREAAQIAEDARTITVRKMEAEQQAAQRQAAADAKARAAAEGAAAIQAKAQAEESARAREEADAAR